MTSCHVIIIIIINIIITINITLCMLRMSANYYKVCFWVGHLTSNKPFNVADLDHDLSSELSNGILTTRTADRDSCKNFIGRGLRFRVLLIMDVRVRSIAKEVRSSQHQNPAKPTRK